MKIKTEIFLAIAAALFLALLAFALFPVSGTRAYADYSPDYSYKVENFDVEMTVGSNRSIEVKEVITASFTGRDSHGIIRDFALGGDVRYYDFSATCDNSDFLPFFQNDDSKFLSYYLRGNGIVYGQERTYTITYRMVVPALIGKSGYLPLDVLGFGWTSDIARFRAVVHLPEGLDSYEVHIGKNGQYGINENASASREGNDIVIEARNLRASWSNEYQMDLTSGITLELQFGQGVLTSSFDYGFIFTVAAGVLLLGAALLVKLFGCRQPVIVKSVSFEAPQQMDPFVMGKYIDNVIVKEDYGALVFWMASKGYLHIDFSEDPKNPILYRSEKPLPADMPAHQRALYEGLFRGRESVRVSALSQSFYKTAEKMENSVNKKAGNLYTKKGFAVFLAFALGIAVLFGLGAFLFPLLVSSVTKNVQWFLAACLVAYIPPAIAAANSVQREYMWKPHAKYFVIGAAVLISLAAGVLLCFVRCAAMTVAAKAVAIGFCAATGVVSGLCKCRTEEYTKKLGLIVGFKQFLLFTERDKIEFMLKENPELYYDILPYAQVLGISDAWTDKFKGLPVNPPSYARGSSFTVFDYMFYSSLFRSFSTNIGSNMVSRPSSSGGSRGFGGFGGGGGGGGGGFGGGGGRGC